MWAGVQRRLGEAAERGNAQEAMAECRSERDGEEPAGLRVVNGR